MNMSDCIKLDVLIRRRFEHTLFFQGITIRKFPPNYSNSHKKEWLRRKNVTLFMLRLMKPRKRQLLTSPDRALSKFWSEMSQFQLSKNSYTSRTPKTGSCLSTTSELTIGTPPTWAYDLCLGPLTSTTGSFPSNHWQVPLALSSQLLNLDSLSMLRSNRSGLEVENLLLLCCSSFRVTPCTMF